jgi:hypothetical protein
VRWLQRLVPSDPRGLRILCYHLVGGDTGCAVDVPARVFRRQLEDLRSRFQVVSLGAAVSSVRRGEVVDRAVALTFDDAYENFYDKAWPLLRELDLPATLFVPVGFVRGEGPAPMRGTGDLGPCSWSQLREMADRGLEVGCHSWTHPDLRRLDDRELRRELVESREELELRLGSAVESFCYPRALWSPRVEARVADGYDFAVAGGGRVTRPPSVAHHRLQRVSVRADAGDSLHGSLRGAVCLEEWLADRIRRWR